MWWKRMIPHEDAIFPDTCELQRYIAFKTAILFTYILNRPSSSNDCCWLTNQLSRITILSHNIGRWPLSIVVLPSPPGVRTCSHAICYFNLAFFQWCMRQTGLDFPDIHYNNVYIMLMYIISHQIEPCSNPVSLKNEIKLNPECKVLTRMYWNFGKMQPQ